MYYRKCPLCGAALDPGEICADCKNSKEEDSKCQSLEIYQIPSSVGSKLLNKQTERHAVRLDGGVDVAVGAR